MTVRFPLRISTTWDALLVSFALLPATKKPQNAWAGRAGHELRASATTTADTTDRLRDMPPPWLSRQPQTRGPPERSAAGQNIACVRVASSASPTRECRQTTHPP